MNVTYLICTIFLYRTLMKFKLQCLIQYFVVRKFIDIHCFPILVNASIKMLNFENTFVKKLEFDMDEKHSCVTLC